jgi:hypothetical protein
MGLVVITSPVWESCTQVRPGEITQLLPRRESSRGQCSGGMRGFNSNTRDLGRETRDTTRLGLLAEFA